MADKLTNDLCRRLGIRYPIYGLAHHVEVCAAISNAGGLGVYGGARDNGESLARKLKRLRELCPGKPIGVDLLLATSLPPETSDEDVAKAVPQGHKDFVKGLFEKYKVPPATHGNFFNSYVRSQSLFHEQMQAVAESDAEIFATAAGTPPELVALAKAVGKETIALVGSVRHAEKAIDAGVDILVAQGYDAGGHTGPIGTFTLIPQIVAVAKGRPVIAAGGIGCGAQVAASIALGAQGAWLGTLWLGTREHELSSVLTDKLIAAESQDTVITRAHSGKPCRILRSEFSDAWAEKGAPEPLAMPFQQALTGELLAAIEQHQIAPLMYEAAGQSIAWVRKIESVDEVMNRLVQETRLAFESMRPYCTNA